MKRAYRADVFRVGDTVQSTYRARWFGVVETITPRQEQNPLITARCVCTADGRPFRKQFTHTYDAYWFTHAELPTRCAAAVDADKHPESSDV